MVTHGGTRGGPGSVWGVLGAALLLGLVVPSSAGALRVRQRLVATGADGDARGKAVLRVSRKRGVLRGQLKVSGRRLAPDTTLEITVDGVRIGTLDTNRRGKGRARFRTTPRSAKDQLLGVDPRGRSLAVLETGTVVLVGALSDDSIDRGDVRCCLPDDSGPECEDRTPAECLAAGGVDLGPGSCLPDPCGGGSAGDVVCCLPDDSGPECEDRTSAQCAALGGVIVDATSCTSAPCAPVAPPAGDVRCCLPDDSGPSCEDRTAVECAALGGLNIGPGACLPDSCFPVGSTSTTLPPAPAVRVVCERRADRSRASVDGLNLPEATYTARLTSAGNAATSNPRATIGDQVEFDFDSDPADIAAGATAIAADFIGGVPATVTGEILDGAERVVVAATALCAER